MKETISVPFSLPSIGEEEISEVVETLRSGWLTTGPRTARFEREFKTYVGTQHALAVNSGTAALHLPLAALGIGRGDEVITTPLTFCATVNVIMQVGATPVLADVGTDGNISPESIAERIGSKTRAVIPVHLGGLPCEMDSIGALAREHGLHVVEDAAHALGARYRGRPIGSTESDPEAASDAVAFSFYATKNATTGEGGMVTSHVEAVAEQMRALSLHGIDKDIWRRENDDRSWYYEVQSCGFKYNLSDLQSAVGIHQLRKLEGFIETRTRCAAFYNRLLSDLEEIELPPDRESCRHAWQLYAIRLRLEKLKINRDDFIRALEQRNIGCSVHFIPIPLHPYFAPFAGDARNQCPRSMELYPRLVSLPLYPEMTEEQVEYVAASVREVALAARRATSFAMSDEYR